ncbi:MAG: N-formylglutamate amidohydrolase [Bdellovibrionales bacterium]|nr:N-formylglutamate amidohydrolase [Bdellovibrionales bacterium]
MFKVNSKDYAVLTSIPHSGLKIPLEAYWLKKLSYQTLMCDVDLFVDDLYDPTLKKYNIPFIVFDWHRYAVDANRFPYNISSKTVKKAQELLETFYQIKKRNFKNNLSDIHWYQTTLNEILIQKPISQKTHQILMSKYFDSYHKKLKKLISKQKKKFVYLLDLHSMPSKATSFHKDKGQLRVDVVIGDNEGKSCSPFFRDLILKAYQEAGFKTSLNFPYKGGAITQSYAQVSKGQEVVQIELNRKLYMDEMSKEKNKDYKKIQLQLEMALSYMISGLEKRKN